MHRRLTVTTAATSSRLATIAAATAEIGGSPDAGEVQRWIDAASAAIALRARSVRPRTWAFGWHAWFRKRHG